MHDWVIIVWFYYVGIMTAVSRAWSSWVADRKQMGFGNSGISVQRWGISVDAAGTLDGARCTVCTIGGVVSGAHVSGVVQSGTLEGIRGIGGNCAGRADGSVRAVSSSVGIAELKMVDSCWRDFIWSSSSVRKGYAGTGRCSASVSILAASTALSTDNTVGILIS